MDAAFQVLSPKQGAAQAQAHHREIPNVFMTKFFTAKVELRLTKTVLVQVSADTEAAAIEQAKGQAQLKEPGLSVQNVGLTLVGESELGVGSRVVHKIFGPGIIEEMHASGVDKFIMQIRFDRGDTKRIHGPGAFIWPEGMATDTA